MSPLSFTVPLHQYGKFFYQVFSDTFLLFLLFLITVRTDTSYDMRFNIRLYKNVLFYPDFYYLFI